MSVVCVLEIYFGGFQNSQESSSDKIKNKVKANFLHIWKSDSVQNRPDLLTSSTLYFKQLLKNSPDKIRC